MKKEEVLDFLSNQKNTFTKDFGISKLGLFGSLARNEKPNDIDIIVEFEPNTESLFEKKIRIKSILEERFNLPTDICREKYLKPSVRQLILRDAIFV
jgi:uncharacterized protein